MWLSVECIDNLIAQFERFKHGDESPFTERFVNTNVNFVNHENKPDGVSVLGGQCICCHDRIERETNRFKLVNPKDTNQLVKFHDDCLDEFVAALEEVWNHNRLLPELV